jgi:transcriptional regulator with XRE-family HTH domain
MSSDSVSDYYLIDSLRILHGLSLRKLAKEANLDVSSLSYTLRGIESRVSRERLKPALKILGLGDDGFLSLGVHKWSIPTISPEEIERVEKTVKKLFPGGGYVRQIRLAGILNPINTPSLVTALAQIAWILVPYHFSKIRILLLIGYHSRMKQILHFPPWGILFRPANFGEKWVWADGSDPTTDSPSSWRNIPREKFNDLMEKDLSVKEFDETLGIISSWTWENLELRGWTPERVAKKLRLENKEWTGESIAAEARPEPDYDSGLTWDAVMTKAKEAGLTPREAAEKLGLSKQ